MAEPATSVATAALLPFRARPIGTIQSAWDYLRMIIYGDPGVGKTLLSCSAADVPEMQDVVVLDLENGILTVTDRTDIDVYDQLYTYRQVAKFKELLAVHCRMRDTASDDDLLAWQVKYLGPAFNDRPRRWKTLVFESLTTVHRLAMNQILNTEISQTDLDAEPEAIDRADWGKALTLTIRLMAELRALPINLIFTAGEQINEVKTTKTHKTTLQLPGQAAKQVQREVDVVGRLVVGHVSERAVRRLYVQPGPYFDAKCRIPKFPDLYIDNPTMTDLINPLRRLRNA